MTIVRRLTALAVIAAGAYAFYLFCFLPYRCNRIKNSLILPTEKAYAQKGMIDGSVQARQNLAVLTACLRPTCRDVSLDMTAAANERVLGRYEDAILSYRHALLRDRRPELYSNLAAAEVAAGHRADAYEDYLRAALFAPWSVQEIDDGQLRHEVVQQLLRLRPENADYIHYVDTVQLP